MMAHTSCLCRRLNRPFSLDFCFLTINKSTLISTPSMPLSFTYSNYPHIFDAFVADTSFETQLALRLSCKSFQQAVDRLHVHHLVLTPHGSNSIDIKGAYRRIPALRRIKPAAWRKEPKLELTSHTRVVDIRGFFPATCNLTLLKDAFPNLDTLRMCTSKSEPKSYTPYVPLAAKTLVLFTSPDGGDCNPAGYDEWDSEEEDEPEFVPKGVSSKLPDKYTKIVVNMNGMDIPIADMFRCALDPPEHVTEVDIIIPVYSSPSARGRIEIFSEHILGMDTAELIGSPHVKYTLVGLDVVKPGYDTKFMTVLRRHVSQWKFGDVDYGKESEPKNIRSVRIGEDGNLEVLDLEPAVEAGSSHENQVSDDSKETEKDKEKGESQPESKPDPKKKMTHKEKVDSILSAVETLTMKEYRQRLGLEQAALQYVEYFRSPVKSSVTGTSHLSQVAMSPDEMDDVSGAFMENLLNPTAETEAAMAEFMHEALNPSPEMEAALAEFMYEALHPSPEMMQAMAEYMAGMHGALGGGAFPGALAGAALGAGLQSETDEDDDEDDEDEKDEVGDNDEEVEGDDDEAEGNDDFDDDDDEDGSKNEGNKGSLSRGSTKCGPVEENKTTAASKPESSTVSKAEGGQEPQKS